MRSVKDFIILALAIAVVAAAVMVWRQHQQLLGIHSQAVAPSDMEGLQKRLADSDAKVRDLTREIEARPNRNGLSQNRRGFGGMTDGRGPGDDIRAVMDQPEMQRLRALQQKSALDGRYATLFRDLKLPTAALEKFKDLLVEKEVTMQDMMAVAREHGIDPRVDPAGFRELVASAQNETDAAIKGLLGNDAFTQYQQYQQTLPQRALINQLQQSLSYTNEPLTESQAAGLIPILASTNPQPNSGNDVPFGPPGPGGPGPGGGAIGPRLVITADAVTEAQSVLSATQLQVLQQMQQSQQAQDQIFRAIRDSMGASGAAGPQAVDVR
jgi:hypothetical protein